MRMTWRSVVAVVAIAGGLGVVGTTAASAANFTTDCTSNLLCVYNQTGFQDNLQRKASGFSHTNLPSSAYDKMSSWENHSTRTGAWFDGTVSSYKYCYTMDSEVVNTDVGFINNDVMRSWQGNNGC